MSTGYFKKLDSNSSHTALDYTQLGGGSEGEVQFPAREVGPPVVDTNHSADPSAQCGHPDQAPGRKIGVGGGHGVHVVDLAEGRLAAIK